MTKTKKISLFLLRISFGWIFLYAGISKLTDPSWSAEGFLKSAKTLSGFYEWLASPANIGWVNFLNEWGLTLIGISLIVGLLVRVSSTAGGVLMLLYYFPSLHFPYVGKHSLLVDQHIVYLLVFALLFTFQAGKFWGLDKYLN
ncbi:MAG: DoxX family protein [Candidatus Magasanikbacteria bacterium]